MDYISGWCKSQRRLEGLTAIVTGANSGIGKETVRDFYLRGARVVMACRDIAKAEEVKTEMEQMKSEQKLGYLVVEKLDLASLKSVREFAFRVLDNENQINILVNNAGVMCCPEGKTEDGFETHMGTNHFGHALLTLLLLPRLRKSAPSRIVFLSSYIHKMGVLDLDDINYEKRTRYNSIVAYSLSKSANLIFSRALANKLKEHDISDVTSYSLHPGVIATELGRYFTETVVFGGSWVFKNILSWFIKSPRCGAQTTIYCAVDEICANQSGLYYSDCAPTDPAVHCQDDSVADKLWDITMEAVKLSNYDPFTKEDPDKNLFVI